MFCPDCNHKLVPIRLQAKEGPVTLDYCKRCGGIWTDHAETNFFGESDLKSIKKLLPKNPTLNLNGPHTCPHDRTELEQLEHESVPYGVTVQHCPKCAGNWFPYHQLDKFKHAQKVKVDYHKVWKIPLHSIYAVLLPVLVLGILISGLIGGIIGTQHRQTTDIQAEDFISTPTTVPISDSEVMVIFTTQTNATSSLEYWIDLDDTNTIAVSKKPQTTHSVRLKGLQKGNTYSYQISATAGARELQSQLYSIEVQ